MADYKITEWHADKIMTLATDVNVRAMEKAALLVESYVKTHFTLQGAGKRYGRHIASIAGEPPAIDTGVLRSSMVHEVKKRAFYVIGLVGVLASVKYALFLELGTHNMKPRPYLRPALRACRRKIEKIFKDANK